MHIRPNSGIDSSITKSVFTVFLHGAHTVCSEKYIMEETQFSVGVFVENGHKRTFLENLVKDYSAKRKNSDCRNYTNSTKIP